MHNVLNLSQFTTPLSSSFNGEDWSNYRIVDTCFCKKSWNRLFFLIDALLCCKQYHLYFLKQQTLSFSNRAKNIPFTIKRPFSHTHIFMLSKMQSAHFCWKANNPFNPFSPANVSIRRFRWILKRQSKLNFNNIINYINNISFKNGLLLFAAIYFIILLLSIL